MFVSFFLFLGIPKKSSAVCSWSTPILHCLFNSSLKTSQFFSGFGCTMAQNGLAPSTKEIAMRVPFHSPYFPARSGSCFMRTCTCSVCCSFVRSWQFCATGLCQLSCNLLAEKLPRLCLPHDFWWIQLVSLYHLE